MSVKLPKPLSRGEETFAQQLKSEGIKFIREYKFHPLRRWKFDFILDIPADQYAIEVEGGSWSGGAHNRGKHFESDCEKYAEAILLGWKVFRFTTEQVTKGYAIGCVKRAIQEIM